MPANPNCGDCHGTGIVYDSVSYGSTNVSMPSPCECDTDIECPICNGKGEVTITLPNDEGEEDTDCLTCDGDGYISPEKYDAIMENELE